MLSIWSHQVPKSPRVVAREDLVAKLTLGTMLTALRNEGLQAEGGSEL